MARANDLRNLGDTELVTRLSEAKAELFNLRFRNVTGQQDDYSQLSKVKKDIARLNTILRQREIELHEQEQSNA